MKDPFENIPNDDEPQEEPVVDTADEEVDFVDATTEKDEASVTLKAGTGYDAPWVVLRSSSVPRLYDMLNDGESVRALLEHSAKVGRFYGDKFIEAKGDAQQPTQGQQTPPQQQAPGGETRHCPHGEMTFRSGVSKQGKPYKAFFCPTPQGTPDQCKPQFLN